MIKRHKTGAYDPRLRCGDKVIRIEDERHEGVVIGVVSGQVHVLWDTNIHEYEIWPEELQIVQLVNWKTRW